MSEFAIEIDGVGKRYKIGASKQRYLSLREQVTNKFSLAARRARAEEQEFWALRDVTFSVKPGESLGIIGRNGAGKSTLLKILSEITPLTEGKLTLRGRVGSLLEVGTGFHPELTGRENIFMNGAILGMTRKEISRKFDEIVAFSEMEKFLDTPVKRYSSGMYVRLAFAVAAHLEPEIMVVDEVLAVGDASFQKRCLGKMGEVAQGGRTVLFVSHSMPMIASLCTRCVLLSQGTVKTIGPTGDVVVFYQSGDKESPARVDYSDTGRAPGDEYARLIAAWIEDEGGEARADFAFTESLRVVMRYEILSRVEKSPYPNFHLYDSTGHYVLVSSPSNIDYDRPVDPGEYLAKCEFPQHFLNDGAFSVGLGLTFPLGTPHVSFYEGHALTFNITDHIHEDDNRARSYAGRIPGVVRPLLNWTQEKVL